MDSKRLNIFLTVHHLQIHNLTPPKQSASITALGVSKDYYVVACRYMFQKVSEIHQLELFDIKSGAYLRAIQGKGRDGISFNARLHYL